MHDFHQTGDPVHLISVEEWEPLWIARTRAAHVRDCHDGAACGNEGPARRRADRAVGGLCRAALWPASGGASPSRANNGLSSGPEKHRALCTRCHSSELKRHSLTKPRRRAFSLSLSQPRTSKTKEGCSSSCPVSLNPSLCPPIAVNGWDDNKKTNVKGN